MFEKLSALLGKSTGAQTGGDGSQAKEGVAGAAPDHKTQIAIAALLIEAARADDEYAPAEADRITDIIGRKVDLTEAATAALMAEAQKAQQSAHDLYQFSRIIKDALSPEDKRALMEDLWRVILVDDIRDPFEDALMRRLGGLIHVSDVEIGRARQAVIAQT